MTRGTIERATPPPEETPASHAESIGVVGVATFTAKVVWFGTNFEAAHSVMFNSKSGFSLTGRSQTVPRAARSISDLQVNFFVFILLLLLDASFLTDSILYFPLALANSVGFFKIVWGHGEIKFAEVNFTI